MILLIMFKAVKNGIIYVLKRSSISANEINGMIDIIMLNCLDDTKLKM